MNYYPYFGNFPMGTAATTARTGIFSRLFGGIKFGSILNGAQQTLNVVNQALPLIKQAKPMFTNAKAMFKVMNEFKKVDTPVNENATFSNNQTNNQATATVASTPSRNSPTFFQ